MKETIRRLAMAVVLAALTGGELEAASGDVLWSTQGVVTAPLSYCEEIAAAADEESVFLWYRQRSIETGSRSLLQRFAVADGGLLWEAAGPPGTQAAAVAAAAGMVFATGIEFAPTSNLGRGRLFVRAFDGESGRALWTRWRRPEGFEFRANAIGTDGRTVVVAGERAPVGASRTSDIFVLALDAVSGEVLWKDVTNLATGRDSARAVVVLKERVFVGGTEDEDPTVIDRSALVRAYSARDGRLLWQEGSARGVVWQLEARGRQLFALDFADEFNGALLRAFDKPTGAVRWTRGVRGTVWSMAVGDERVYASVLQSRSGTTRIRAFDRRTGTTRWGRALANGTLESLEASRGQLYLAGEQRSQLILSRRREASGELAWRRQDPGRNPDFVFSIGCEILLFPDRVVVAGLGDGPEGDPEYYENPILVAFER